MAAGGVTFREACRVLKDEYRSADRPWASFGDYDRKQFDRQCRETGVSYPFGPRHLNVKTLFAVAHGLPAEVGMPQAVGMLGLSLEGTYHRGHDDAWNIAGVLVELLRRMRSVP